MKIRIEALTGITATFFPISAFHALGLRILHESGSALGFDSQWQVIDGDEQRRLALNPVDDLAFLPIVEFLPLGVGNPGALFSDLLDRMSLDGRFIVHPIFGRGRVVEKISESKYLIHFTDKGEKLINASVVQVEFI